MARRWPLMAVLWAVGLAAGASLDLSGTWRFALDRDDSLLRAKPGSWPLPDKVTLPGLLTAQGFGDKPSYDTAWTGDGWRYPALFREWQAPDKFGMPFFLQPPRHYVGAAWYQRDVDLPAAWQGQALSLFLERVHWRSTVWLDEREVGSADSLGTPHELELGSVTPGRHRLTLRIDNRLSPVNVGPLSHSVTDHTQGNWNGVVGTMALRARPPVHLLAVRAEPSLAARTVRLVVSATPGAGRVSAAVRYVGPARAEASTRPVTGELVDGRAELSIAVNMALPWDEFTPHRFSADVTLDSAGGQDRQTVIFGFRDLSRRDGRLALSGRPIFLRGTLECCIFPRTGHPPTDIDSWRRIVRICRAHGLNHIRFHSWCPPEAAFEAADEAGFYFQLEASSWANSGAEIGSGRPLDAWLEAETERMVRSYGNHPSFLMMAYGNEPAGAQHQRWLADWVKRWRAADPRHFWTTGSGWPVLAGSDYHSSPNPRIQGWGEGLRSVINAQPPRTDFDFAGFVNAHADAPVVSHEIGQWCVYPNFAEIDKYTGYFRPRNLEIFRETARRNGLLPQAHDFLMASGALQTLCYKHDIEAALRTPGFGGFQLLDLHDFPGQGTALVGVLDAFWDSKGYVTPAEYARFAGPIVPLARLPKMVYRRGETLSAELQLAHFGPRDLSLTPTWRLTQGDRTLARGSLPYQQVTAGALHTLGSISIPLAEVTAPAQVRLTVGAAGQPFGNAWDLFVYPDRATPEPALVVVASDLGEVRAALAEGKRVLWLAHGSVADDRARPLVAGFSSMFWNTAWTNWQPPHTLGILCDPRHPALAAFPTESHSNWQWWEIQQGARPFILTAFRELRPVVQVIDDWITSRKLGYVFEAQVGAGRLIACSADLSSSLDKRPAAQQLRASLLAYLAGARLAPAPNLNAGDLDTLVQPPSVLRRLGVQATASSAEPAYDAANAIDGDARTMWHTEYTARTPELPHELTLRFAAPAALTAVRVTQRQDHIANGQADRLELRDGGGQLLATARVPADAVDYRIALPAGTRVTELRLRVVSSHKGPWAALAEVDVEP